jgi:membrane fusion protein, multidrug efflux system
VTGIHPPDPGPSDSGAAPAAPRLDAHASTEQAPQARPVAGRRIGMALAVGAGILVLAFAIGTIPRLTTAHALAAVSQADPTPTVEVAHVARAAPGTDLSLPGTLEPLHQAAIYARTSGYVKRWSVDIGRAVHAGEVLAVIETPDLDEQLAQSRAALEQARSTFELAKVERARWAAMIKDSVVTTDEYDQKAQAERAGAAAVAAAEADVRRLTALQSFEHVTAPFEGIVTGRNVDVGAFVQAGGGVGGALPSNGSSAPTSLFQLAQTDTVRVYVSVPQTYAPAIQPGQTADVRVQEFPNQVFTGRIVRTARAEDPQSRTLLTEVQIVNAKGVLLPGMYAQIRFLFARAHPPLVVPATALLPLTDGMQVLEVDADRRVHRRHIDILRDYGAYVETDSGLTEGASIVLNPSDALTDGTEVRVQGSPAGKD